MADISKCKGIGCDKKKTCYRYLAKESDVWQSWIGVMKRNGEKCQFYWPVNKTKKFGGC